MRFYLLLLTVGMVNLGIAADSSGTSAPGTSHFGKSGGAKLIFSDTPHLGKPWRGGIRSQSIFIWDFYFTVDTWFLVDFLVAGLPEFAANEETGERLADYFTVLTLKSRPLNLLDNRYSLAGGIKRYESVFMFDSYEMEDALIYHDAALGIFATQAFEHKRLRGNLLSTLYFRSVDLPDGQEIVPSYQIVPGFSIGFGPRYMWRFDCEYYMFNFERLPIKFIQILSREDNLPFFNRNHDLTALVFWGVSFVNSRMRVDLHLGHYPQSLSPFIPFFGFGWHF